MKKVLVIGAHGKVGQLATTQLAKANDFEPTALFRKAEQQATFKELGIDYKVVSLEGDVATLAQAMNGMDAIVFSAGSGGKTGHDKTLEIDLDGAVKAMEAAEQAGVNRFVMVSAIKADDRSLWEASGLKPYYIAKHYADRILKASNLDYTILRPGRLLDEPGSGKITTTNALDNAAVPREDVASVIVEALRNDNSIGKIIEFNAGEMPIEQAVKAV